MSADSAVSGTRAEEAGLARRLGAASLARLAATAFQFGLLILVIRAFQIESRAFLNLCVLTWFGFLVHHLLPPRFRMAFFASLSVAGLGLVLGPANAAWVVALGLGLIGLAHLPVAFGWRVALLAAVAAGMAAFRAGVAPAGLSLPGSVWTILGSMFMFRLIVYLYDLKNRAAPFSFWHAASYFFLLPNVCFPLFPVIDYKTFCRTYASDRDEIHTYQTGVAWMLRGCIHLLLYRLVYQNLVLDPAVVSTGREALQFVVSTYLLYLRISGSFHLIVGMLHLFGFGLPETHHNYLLASSFTDFWRRINIYWKDFIQKIVFNPLYFPLSKRLGETRAIVAATAVAFFATWLLHSYQWFWIRGTFPIIWQDMAFWGVFGALLCVNMLLERSRGRRRTLRKVRRTARDELGLALRTVATFCFLCVAWWVWSSHSLEEFRLVAGKLLLLTPAEVAALAAGLAGLGVAAVVLGRSGLEQSRAAKEKRAKESAGWFWRSSAAVAAGCVALLAVGRAPQALPLPEELASALDRVQVNKLNKRDAAELERGYYEDLTNVARFDDQLASLYAQRPDDWTDQDPATVTTGSFPRYVLLPSTHAVYRGVSIQTNRFGMRDREYEQAKPAGSYRIALLGDSHSKGQGVDDGLNWESVLEERLNREAKPGRRYEILNFSVGGYGPLSRLAILPGRVLEFSPDAVIFAGVDDLHWIVNELSHAAADGREIPFPHVREVVAAAGVTPGMARVTAEALLRPHARELVAWVMDEFVKECRGRGVQPLAVFLPRPEDGEIGVGALPAQQELARAAGFTVLDANDAYRSAEDVQALWVREWDHHPNARGHELLAGEIHESLGAWLETETGAPRLAGKQEPGGLPPVGAAPPPQAPAPRRR
jgi:D-alanyl-lipoteichoic acid acyltransferase DltB (MBOAT superfamily)